jgi:predicted transcriptional regulator
MVFRRLMKTEKKVIAIGLRKKGLSFREIRQKLGVSKSSVSLWVRGVKLTKEQKKVLANRVSNKTSYSKMMAGAEGARKKGEENRNFWRRLGHEDAKKRNWLYTVDCMLYWAEGYKKNNWHTVKFSNSDLSMVKLFMRFLENSLEINKKDITVYINCYTDIHSLGEIEKYWVRNLNIKTRQLRKTTADNRPLCTKRKINGALEWGTCCIVVNNTSAIQRIYGSIEEYGNTVLRS